MDALDEIIPGFLYDANNDPEILKLRTSTKEKLFRLNHTNPSEEANVKRQFRELFGQYSDSSCIELPFYCDYGRNIFLGEKFYSNHSLTILDAAEVRIGDNVFIGPNVGMHTSGHPIDFERRNKGLEYALPIRINDDVWIGSCVTIIGGVTIGRGTVIAAGSVVIRDLPGNVVAAGNPCQVIRNITAKDRFIENFKR
ncbi:probable Putative acetyltransferase YJL218W [Zygosaccharomyces bailii]|nr:probable Putative acetyltransferase YJL218W [Zygosaccharomyces bailii]